MAKLGNQFVPKSCFFHNYNENFFLKKWVDELLTWKPADYENIEVLRVPVEKPWTPGNFDKTQ